MPAYNFQNRFAAFVKEGSKTCTIRAIRKHPAKPGDTLYLYTGMRTKQAFKLRQETCTRVDTIFIWPDNAPIIILSNHILSEAGEIQPFKDMEDPFHVIEALVKTYGQKNVETWMHSSFKDGFAWADGFRFTDDLTRRDGCFELMLRYWQNTHALPFVGHHIHWKPTT